MNRMPEKTIKKEEYIVEGMTCSGCERTVSKVVQNIAGVQSAKADQNSSTVLVEYDPSKVNIDKIKSASIVFVLSAVTLMSMISPMIEE